MPTGQPDSPSVPEQPSGPRRFSPENVETTADRIVREAMDAGDFDELPGTGKPLPGAGRVDDDLWWVRSWIERDRDPDDQDSSSSE